MTILCILLQCVGLLSHVFCCCSCDNYRASGASNAMRNTDVLMKRTRQIKSIFQFLSLKLSPWRGVPENSLQLSRTGIWRWAAAAAQGRSVFAENDSDGWNAVSFSLRDGSRPHSDLKLRPKPRPHVPLDLHPECHPCSPQTLFTAVVASLLASVPALLAGWRSS